MTGAIRSTHFHIYLFLYNNKMSYFRLIVPESIFSILIRIFVMPLIWFEFGDALCFLLVFPASFIAILLV